MKRQRVRGRALPLRRGRSSADPGARPQGPIVPAGSVQSLALLITVAIMGYLACMTAAGVSIVARSTAAWRSDIVREVTIQVRPASGGDVEAAVSRAVAVVSGAPGVGRVTPMTAEETRRLLEPWLGSGVDLSALPVPRLVTVEIADARAADLPGLAARLAAEVPGASLDDHASWADRLAAMATSAVLAGMGAVALVLAATALAVVFATRAAMAECRDVLEVLHLVGAEDRFVAREFERHFLSMGLVGGLIGGGAAAATLFALELALGGAIGTPQAEEAAALFGSFEIGPEGWLACLAVVILLATTTSVTSRLAVHSHLAAID